MVAVRARGQPCPQPRCLGLVLTRAAVRRKRAAKDGGGLGAGEACTVQGGPETVGSKRRVVFSLFSQEAVRTPGDL